MKRDPLRHWFARLAEYLPESFIDGHFADLVSLWLDGATVAQSAIYARLTWGIKLA